MEIFLQSRIPHTFFPADGETLLVNTNLWRIPRGRWQPGDVLKFSCGVLFSSPNAVPPGTNVLLNLLMDGVTTLGALPVFTLNLVTVQNPQFIFFNSALVAGLDGNVWQIDGSVPGNLNSIDFHGSTFSALNVPAGFFTDWSALSGDAEAVPVDISIPHFFTVTGTIVGGDAACRCDVLYAHSRHLTGYNGNTAGE